MITRIIVQPAKESTNLLWERIHRVFLMDHDPSDLGSLILIRVMPKECTLKTLTQINFMTFVLVKKRVKARVEIAQATNRALDNVRFQQFTFISIFDKVIIVYK